MVASICRGCEERVWGTVLQWRYLERDKGATSLWQQFRKRSLIMEWSQHVISSSLSAEGVLQAFVDTYTKASKKPHL